MAAKRKEVTMIVTVSVPEEMTAAEARREVRGLINAAHAEFGHATTVVRIVPYVSTRQGD